MKMAMKIVTPVGTILGDIGEDLTEVEYEQISKMFEDVNSLGYLTVAVNGSNVFLAKGIIQQSCVFLVKDPDWLVGKFIKE